MSRKWGLFLVALVFLSISACSMRPPTSDSPTPTPPISAGTATHSSAPSRNESDLIVYDIMILFPSRSDSGLRIISSQEGLQQEPPPVQWNASYPEWSHARDRILYMVPESTIAELYSLWTVDVDRGSVRQLTSAFSFSQGVWGGKWSSDDRYIAFRITDEALAREYVLVIDSVTGQPVQKYSSWGYAWSHQGRKLALLADAPEEALLVTDLDTSEEQLFPDAMAPYPWLAWAPDDKKIAFVDWTLDTLINRVKVLDVATGRLHTFQPQAPLISRSVRDLSWSPDGRFLLYISDPRQEGELRPAALYLLDVSTGMEKRLVEEAGSPEWSPSSREIAFMLSINVANPNQMYKINIETGAVTQLTDDAYIKQSLSWR